MKLIIFLIFSLFVINTNAHIATTVLKMHKWVEIKNEDGIKIYKDENNKADLILLKAESTFNGDILRIVSVLANNKRKDEWLPNYGGSKTLKLINTLERIEYSISDAPWPFTDRDFVFKTTTTIDRKDRSVTINMKSIRGYVPKKDNYVRGEMVMGEAYLKYIKKNKTFFSLTFATDPKGNLPKWLANYAAKSWPFQFITGMKSQLKKIKTQKNFYLSNLKSLALKK